MKKNAFTLVEVIIVLCAVSIVMMFLYRIMSGTSTQIVKNQTKLSNLRAASIIVEHIKEDLRMSLMSTKDVAFSENSLKFKIYDKKKKKRGLVAYTYNAETAAVMRKFGSDEACKVSQIKVASFTVKVSKQNARKRLVVSILVDNDKDMQKRTQSSLGNQIMLQTELYPRFYEENLSEEERYWNYAREAS